MTTRAEYQKGCSVLICNCAVNVPRDSAENDVHRDPAVWYERGRQHCNRILQALFCFFSFLQVVFAKDSYDPDCDTCFFRDPDTTQHENIKLDLVIFMAERATRALEKIDNELFEIILLKIE
jgi:hypothetical protein